ncbi:MAG: hypothetical protein A3J28_06170 [Acidobacteria bacterium RIFCSPLOWO2_12_FULL_60_22]|nr:MAG: hypothetical protein A3J28_06170 [Acidobacteria bacterium RIFCSPLOWO2_12_FULL_60_22]
MYLTLFLWPSIRPRGEEPWEEGVGVKEGFFAILKRGNYGVYHHWSRKYLGQYLREFDWRYNVRKLPDMERAVVALKLTGGKRLLLKPPASVQN